MAHYETAAQSSKRKKSGRANPAKKDNTGKIKQLDNDEIEQQINSLLNQYKETARALAQQNTL